MNDKEVTIVIKGNAQQLASALSTAKNGVKSLGSSAAPAIAPFKATFQEAKSIVDSTVSSIESVGRKAIAVGASVGAALGFGVKYQADIETTTMGFTTLLGSVEEATKAVDMIKKDAASTPFEFVGLAQANQLLTSVTGDAGKSEKILMNVGKALSAMGKGQPELDRIIINLQQIAQVGYASEIDMKQFAYAGVDAYKLIAESTGMTVQQVRALQDEGKLTFDMLTDAFNNAGEGSGKYAKAFENANGTFAQVWSNMKDTVGQSMASIVQDSGLFDQVKQTIKGFSDWVSANKGAIAAFVKDAFQWLKDNGGTIQAIVIGIAVAYGTLKTIALGMAVVTGIQNAIKLGLIAWQVAVMAVTAAQWLLNAAMSANPIGIIILAITALIAAIVAIIMNWDKVVAVFRAAGKIISDVFNNVVKFITDIWNGIVGFFQGLWDGIVAIFTGFVDWIREWGLTILAVIFWPFSLAIGLIIQNWSTISAFFQGVWNGIVAVFTPVINFFSSIFQGAWNGIVAIWNFVVAYYTGIWNGIVAVFSVVGTFFKDMFTNAWNGIVAIFGPIVSWFGNIFQQAWNNVMAVFGAVGGFFRGIWNTITGIFGSIGTAISDAVSGAFKGVLNTVVGGAVDLINGFIRGINTAIDIINNIPGVKIGRLGELPKPKFADGGIVDATTGGRDITVAEGGQNEWIVPESKMASVVRQLSSQAGASQQESGYVDNRVFHVNVTVENDGTDFTEAQAVGMAKMINQALRAQGLSANEMGVLR